METIDSDETNVNSFSPTRGEGPWEIARRSVRCYPRTVGTTMESRRMPGPGPDSILATGAACGLCQDGRVRHFRPMHGEQMFIGLQRTPVDPQTTLVTSRGTVRLNVQGAEKARIGMQVFVEDVDSFTIAPTSTHARVMGIIQALFQDTSFALVAFKAEDDTRPFHTDPNLQETGRR